MAKLRPRIIRLGPRLRGDERVFGLQERWMNPA
jgi:hypothetical protein